MVPKTNYDLRVLQLGDRKEIPILETEFNEAQGQFSPDGRWLAYVSDATGTFEVYVQPFLPVGQMSGAKWQISTGGGIQPKWRRDGKELFYLTLDRKLMAVEMKMNPSSVEAGAAKFLFNAEVPHADYGPTQQRNHYVVTADGKRFLIKTPVGDATSAAITVVVNWTAELKNK